MRQAARILLVEDNEADAFLFSEILAEAGPAGCSLETVSSLQAALARIGAGGLDVVVSDLGLPDSSGLDTVRRLEAADPDLALVALTGREDDETALAALREGAQDYLVKGCVDGDLVWRSLRYAIERKRSEMILRESEWRYRNLFQSIRDALAFTDMEGRITEANEPFLGMLGYTREELVGRSLRDITPEASLLKEKREHEASVLERGYSDIYEKEYRRKDGSLCPVEIRAFLLKDERGRPSGMWAIVRDIVERRRAEEALGKAFRENERLLDELRHRAKNSFAMISAMIEIAIMGAADGTDAVLRQLGARVGSVSSLYSLLYESGSFAEVRLDEYCARVAQAIVGLAPGLEFETELEPVVIPAKRAAALGLALTELATNSVKYGYPEGRRGRILLTLRRSGSRVSLSLADDGVGLCPGFDPFAQAGTGLSLVRGLAGQIDGSFRLEGGPGWTRGTLDFELEEPSRGER